MIIAVLITSHNRRNKTLLCLSSLKSCLLPDELSYDVYLLDDASIDDTKEAVSKQFPSVTILNGNGNLYWAGGMRTLWKYVKTQKNYDGYLLLNDDVILTSKVLVNLFETHNYSLKTFEKGGIYVSATKDFFTDKITYSGCVIQKKIFKLSTIVLSPSENPVQCSLANANILLVMKNVVEAIGIIDERYIHGIADYDYTYTAYKCNFPLLLATSIGGYCQNDHSVDWMKSNTKLKDRINYLYSVKGLSYYENIYYLKKHFKQQLPYYFMMYWLKTFFPVIWEKFKKIH